MRAHSPKGEFKAGRAVWHRGSDISRSHESGATRDKCLSREARVPRMRVGRVSLPEAFILWHVYLNNVSITRRVKVSHCCPGPLMSLSFGVLWGVV